MERLWCSSPGHFSKFNFVQNRRCKSTTCTKGLFYFWKQEQCRHCKALIWCVFKKVVVYDTVRVYMLDCMLKFPVLLKCSAGKISMKMVSLNASVKSARFPPSNAFIKRYSKEINQTSCLCLFIKKIEQCETDSGGVIQSRNSSQNMQCPWQWSLENCQW